MTMELVIELANPTSYSPLHIYLFRNNFHNYFLHNNFPHSGNDRASSSIQHLLPIGHAHLVARVVVLGSQMDFQNSAMARLVEACIWVRRRSADSLGVRVERISFDGG